VHNNSRFPEVNARLADADLFGDFGNRHAFLILAALGTATVPETCFSCAQSARMNAQK
jgi:hypothetical protein